MKIARHPRWERQDRFEASEKGLEVRIGAYGHRVYIEIKDQGQALVDQGGIDSGGLTLHELSFAITEGLKILYNKPTPKNGLKPGRTIHQGKPRS